MELAAFGAPMLSMTAAYAGCLLLSDCLNMDFGGITLEPPARAYLYLCSAPPAASLCHAPQGGLTGITVSAGGG